MSVKQISIFLENKPGTLYIVVVNISNVPGGLNRVLEVLYDAKISVEHTYSIISHSAVGGGGKTHIWRSRPVIARRPQSFSRVQE